MQKPTPEGDDLKVDLTDEKSEVAESGTGTAMEADKALTEVESTADAKTEVTAVGKNAGKKDRLQVKRPRAEPRP